MQVFIMLLNRIKQMNNNITHNKLQLEQQMSQSMQQNFSICTQKIPDFISLINHSLYGKYSSSQNFYYAKQVNEILQQAISPAYIQFQDNNFYDDQQQYLRREYRQDQYPKKIQMLSQYYKFHRDIPTWNDRHIQGIMGKYYSRVKDVDYKKIKSVLKKQQGISLTTQKSFSSMDNSQYTKKSRYSTMLNELQHSNDSIFFKDLCQKIGKAFKKVKLEKDFRGVYYSGQKKFEQFLKKQNKRAENKKQHKNDKNFNINLKRLKYNPKLNTNTRDQQITDLKQVIYPSTHSMRDRRYASIKNTISVQKTTANETISREQKSRRQKIKNVVPSSSRSSMSRKKILSNNIQIQNNFLCKAKSSKNYNIASIINQINSQNLKSINEIYRSTDKLDRNNQKDRKEKIAINFLKRNTSKQLNSNLKLRSMSQKNLPTSTLNRDSSRKNLGNTLKSNRSVSQKKLPIKTSTIELDSNNHVQAILTGRQNSNRILRSNSSNKINCRNQKQYTTNKVIGQKNFKKRNSTIEDLLDKKLNIFKKKQNML